MTEPRPKYSRLPRWLVRAYALPGVINVLSQIVRVPCAIAPLLPGSHWAVLHKSSEERTLGDLENAFGRKHDRQLYNTRIWRVAQRTRRTHLSELWGFSDLTVPVVVAGKAQALICSGPFLRHEPDASELERSWRRLSDRAPRQLDPLFVAFVRLALGTPVLTESALRAYRSFLEITADIVAGEGDAAAQLRRIELLRNRHFAKLPEAVAARTAIMIDPVKAAQWTGDRLEYWDRDELGVAHIPNVALAVMRLRPDAEADDPLTQMLRLHEFQRRFVAFARTAPETLATQLEDHGVFVLTWQDPKRKAMQTRAGVRKLAEAVAEFARKELGAKVRIGVGGLGLESAALPEYGRQSVIAMQLAAHDDRPLCFYDDRAPAVASPSRDALDAERELVTAYFEGTRQEFAAVRAEYLARVLEESAGSPAVARVWFEHCLRGILERVRAQSPLDERTWTATVQRLGEDLARASTTAALVSAFRAWIDTLGELRRRPGSASVELRLEDARSYIRRECSDDLDLSRVARQVGLSPAYFSHLFRASFGVGFARFLSDCRVERARRLLGHSELSVARIAHESGFGSLAHFHAVFKTATGATPAQYRRAVTGSG